MTSKHGDAKRFTKSEIALKLARMEEHYDEACSVITKVRRLLGVREGKDILAEIEAARAALMVPDGESLLKEALAQRVDFLALAKEKTANPKDEQRASDGAEFLSAVNVERNGHRFGTDKQRAQARSELTEALLRVADAEVVFILTMRRGGKDASNDNCLAGRSVLIDAQSGDAVAVVGHLEQAQRDIARGALQDADVALPAVLALAAQWQNTRKG